MLLVDVDHHLFDRLQALARLIVGAEHDARPGDAEFEALPAHGLDQDGELEFAATLHDVAVGQRRIGDPQRHIAFGFLVEAVANDAARHLIALGAGERAVVDDERHRQGRRVDRLGVKGLRHFRHAERIGDVELGQAGDRHDVAGFGQIDRRALDAAERQDLRHAAGLDDVAVIVQDLDVLVGLHAARLDTARDEAAEVRVGFEQRAKHPKGTLLDRRLRDVLQDQLEQRCHAVLRAVRRVRHPAIAAGSVEDREIELFVVGVERREEVEDVVDDFLDTGVGTVDLVDRHDGTKPELQGLADDEFGLRHRAFSGVDEDDHAVNHRQDPLDLTTEIGVTRRVHDIDPRVLPDHRRDFGQNRNAALLLEVVRVHHAFGDALVLAERTRLLEQLVDQRCLAVVDVGDDGDVTKLHGSRRALSIQADTGAIRLGASTGRTSPPFRRRG